jgi:hypothetical protein
MARLVGPERIWPVPSYVGAPPLDVHDPAQRLMLPAFAAKSGGFWNASVDAATPVDMCNPADRERLWRLQNGFGPEPVAAPSGVPGHGFSYKTRRLV